MMTLKKKGANLRNVWPEDYEEGAGEEQMDHQMGFSLDILPFLQYFHYYQAIIINFMVVKLLKKIKIPHCTYYRGLFRHKTNRH